MEDIPEIAADNLEEAIRYCIRKMPEIRSEIENKDIILFIGLSRSGKSTLINCVIDTPLIAERSSRTYKIAKVNPNDDGPVIGEGSVSATSLPHLYYDTYNRIVVDCPGLFDNRGPARELINAMFLAQIKHASSCKFVCVSDINSIIHDNIDPFINSLTNLVELVNTDLSESLLLVFTKADNDVTSHHILNIFDTEIVSQRRISMNEKVRDLLTKIPNRSNCIAFFCLPTQEGVITQNNELLDGYSEAIDESKPLCMKKVQTSLSISCRTKLIIKKKFATFTESIQFNDIVLFGGRIQLYTKPQYVFASFDNELLDILKDIELITNMLGREKTDFKTIVQISDSIYRLCNNDRSHDFFHEVSFYQECDIDSTYSLPLIRKYSDWMLQLIKTIGELETNILQEQKHRKDINFKFVPSSIGIGIGTLVSIAGGVGIRAAAVEAIPAVVPTALVAATPVIGTVALFGGIAAAAGGLGVVIYQLIRNKKETNRRLDLRKKQGRPVPSEPKKKSKIEKSK